MYPKEQKLHNLRHLDYLTYPWLWRSNAMLWIYMYAYIWYLRNQLNCQMLAESFWMYNSRVLNVTGIDLIRIPIASTTKTDKMESDKKDEKSIWYVALNKISHNISLVTTTTTNKKSVVKWRNNIMESYLYCKCTPNTRIRICKISRLYQYWIHLIFCDMYFAYNTDFLNLTCTFWHCTHEWKLNMVIGVKYFLHCVRQI